MREAADGASERGRSRGKMSATRVSDLSQQFALLRREKDTCRSRSEAKSTSLPGVCRLISQTCLRVLTCNRTATAASAAEAASVMTADLDGCLDGKRHHPLSLSRVQDQWMCLSSATDTQTESQARYCFLGLECTVAATAAAFL